MIKEAKEQVRIVRNQLKAAQSRQKSYYDRHHRQESYNRDEKAYLRVTPLKGTQRFGIKGKLGPVTLDLSAFSLNMEKLPTSLNYLRTFPEYMMYSMCHNSGVASRTPSAKSTMKPMISKMTFHMESTLFVYLIPQIVLLVVIRSSSSKCNGHITPRKEQPGKEK